MTKRVVPTRMKITRLRWTDPAAHLIRKWTGAGNERCCTKGEDVIDEIESDGVRWSSADRRSTRPSLRSSSANLNRHRFSRSREIVIRIFVSSLRSDGAGAGRRARRRSVGGTPSPNLARRRFVPLRPSPLSLPIVDSAPCAQLRLAKCMTFTPPSCA